MKWYTPYLVTVPMMTLFIVGGGIWLRSLDKHIETESKKTGRYDGFRNQKPVELSDAMLASLDDDERKFVRVVQGSVNNLESMPGTGNVAIAESKAGIVSGNNQVDTMRAIMVAMHIMLDTKNRKDDAIFRATSDIVAIGLAWDFFHVPTPEDGEASRKFLKLVVPLLEKERPQAYLSARECYICSPMFR
jgi:hypothetical protein